MKIVDVCAFYAPRSGGVRTYVDRKLEAAARQGHEMVVIAPGECDHDEPRDGGGRVRWLRSPRFPLDANYRYFADRDALHRALDEEAAGVVEVSSPWRSAAMVADWEGPGVRAMIAHADPLSAYAYRWFGSVADRATIDRGFDWYWRHLRRLDAQFDVVVSASESLSERLRAGGLRKVVTNAMGVEEGRFSAVLRDPRVRTELLDRCGLGDDALLLLGVGRHAPEKRWDLVVQAAAAAGRDHPIGLVIVGDGHARGRVISARAGNPHVQLLAPIMDRAALAVVMASADALIHGCEAETFCFVAAEAVASGLPVIAPDLGGAADHARASGGYLYQSGRVADAGDAILECFHARERRPRAARPDLRTMDDHFAALFDCYAGLARARHAA